MHQKSQQHYCCEVLLDTPAIKLSIKSPSTCWRKILEIRRLSSTCNNVGMLDCSCWESSKLGLRYIKDMLSDLIYFFIIGGRMIKYRCLLVSPFCFLACTLLVMFACCLLVVLTATITAAHRYSLFIVHQHSLFIVVDLITNRDSISKIKTRVRVLSIGIIKLHQCLLHSAKKMWKPGLPWRNKGFKANSLPPWYATHSDSLVTYYYSSHLLNIECWKLSRGRRSGFTTFHIPNIPNLWWNWWANCKTSTQKKMESCGKYQF